MSSAPGRRRVHCREWRRRWGEAEEGLRVGDRRGSEGRHPAGHAEHMGQALQRASNAKP